MIISKKIVFVICIVAVAASHYVHAADISVPLQVPIMNEDTIEICIGDYCAGIANYIKLVYQFVIGFAVALAVIALCYGGVRWMLAGGASKGTEDAKKIIWNALAGLLIALCSYLLLATVSARFVTFQPIKIPDIEGINLTLKTGSVSALPGGRSTSTFDPARKTATGVWTEISGIHIWVSDTFKSGDSADVIYYLHGDLSGYPDPERPGMQTTWSYMRYEAPEVIGKKINSGAMGPVVLAMPYDDIAFSEVKDKTKTNLTAKGISIASESLLGHSSGGSKIATILKSGGTFKSIGLIDPSAKYLDDGTVNKYKSAMRMIYNPRNWGGRYRGNRKELERVAKILESRAQLITTNHSDIILKYLDGIDGAFK